MKTPKTESSVRKVFLPKSVANILEDTTSQTVDVPDDVDAELPAKVLANPVMKTGIDNTYSLS